MKKLVSIIVMITTAIIAISGCEQFSTSYERIDASEFRMLKYFWKPTNNTTMADIAPGDTVALTAVFAGKQMDLDKDLVEWWVSFNMVSDILGSTTVVDSMELMPISKNPFVDFSPHTQAIELKFRVPPDIVKKSASIPDDWASALPVSLRDKIPQQFASMGKDSIVDYIDSLADNVGVIRPNIAKMLIPVLQFFTVPMRVSTKVRKESNRLQNTIISTQTVRYNKRFMEADIPVNYAPKVDKVVVYKVKGSDVSNIDNKSAVAYDSIILKISDNFHKDSYRGGDTVITVEKGYSYFLDAITNNIDTTVTMDGNRIPEKHRIYRHFQLDAKETAGIHHSKFMDIDNLSGKITMPADRNITKFVFWVEVYDEVWNERLRPNGETMVEVSGRLVYK